MNEIYSTFDETLQKELLNRISKDDENKEDIYYETFIQYFTSKSHLIEEYDTIAYKLSIEQHERKTEECFIKTIENIEKNQDITGKIKSLLDESFKDFIMKNRDIIGSMYLNEIKNTEKFKMTYFGWKTIYRSYLIRTHKGVMERLDHLWFRVALFLYRDDYEKVKKTFHILRKGEAIHATPTLFNAGLINGQMASCFLLGTDDSVVGIYKTIGDAALISKYSGGLGIHISNIRGKNSYIHGTNGYSSGILPMLRVYNDTSRYIDQCFEGSTPIITNRGIINIRDIKPLEDYVLTRNGTFNKVLKKLVHGIQKDMVIMDLETPWKQKIRTILTKHHDIYWNNPVNQEKEFLSIEKAHFGCNPVYIQPESIDVPFSLQECWVLGYLYANMNTIDLIIWDFTLPLEKYYSHMIISFMDLHYKDCFTQINNNIRINLNEYNSGTPSIIDFDFVRQKDIPFNMILTVLPKLRSFYEGYIYQKSLTFNNAKLNMIEYRLGCLNTNARIQSIQNLENENRLMYDLEVENEHNYQTLFGLVHNGGGKRKGAFAMYIEPWHSDIFDFIQAKKNTGNEEERTRDLFLALWIPDIFMKCVENDDNWYLMSENQSPNLSDKWGIEFDELYNKYIQENKFVRKIKARDLWIEILKSQIETGIPYILYKDNCNRCSNQQNLGTIKSSNLCCEIIEYSDKNEYAVCNLASISLSSCLKNKIIDPKLSFWIFGKEDCFYCILLKSLLDKYNIKYIFLSNKNDLTPDQYDKIKPYNHYPIVYRDDIYIGGFQETWKSFLQPEFDFEKLGDLTMQLVENLNQIIDLNNYPLDECKTSNLKNRPIGLGVQGLSDIFMALLEPYDSPFARTLNKKIFETMYYFSLKKSHELALKHGHYNSFKGSPLSKGILHFQYFDEWQDHISYDWDSLRNLIIKDGVRNSLFIAPMPTASTSQILGNTESFEPLTSNFYLRRTLAGEFYVMNHYLRYFLQLAKSWNDTNIQQLIIDKGSVFNMNLPKQIKNIFRTVWEIPQKNLIEMAADRQMFIDQSQSFNIYLNKPDMTILTKIHFYGWKKKLKTGCYYLRSRSAISSQNFNIEPSDCISCSS